MVGAQDVRLVGRGEQVDRLRRARTSRSTSRPDYVAPARRRGHGRDLRRRPVHHDGRRPRLAVRAQRPARRAAADALRAARVAGRQRALPGRRARTRRRSRWQRAGQPATPSRATRATRSSRPPTGSPSTTRPAAMSRWLPWLAELQPEMFAEIDPVLARERGIEDGGWMTIAHRARRDRGARAGDRPRSGRCSVGGRDDPPGRRCPGTGASRGPVTGDAANDLDRALGRPERRRSRRPRRSSATSARAAQRAAPASSPASTTRRPAWRPTATIRRRPRPRATSDRDRHPAARRRAHGLLHRHDGVHRLQGVRGGLQAVERPARRRRRVPAAAAPTTTPAS